MASSSSPTGAGGIKVEPPRSPASVSPRVSPAPLGVGSQQSTVSASSSARADYRPALSGDTPLPNDDSKPVGKKEPVSEAALSPQLSTSLSTSKVDPSDDDPFVSNGHSPSALDKIKRIFDCFIIRTPHAFFAMMVTYGECYMLNKESFGYNAALFVGIAGTVYNIISAFSWEIIPNYQLSRGERNGKFWRNLIDLTNTCFITTVFTSAVWKLPEISPIQGFFLFGLNYGLTYLFLKSFHPNINKQPSWAQQRLE